MKRTIYHITFLFLTLVCCVDPFTPTNVQFGEVLVIDGFLSSASQQHTVRVSRTSRINSKVFIPETGATVRVSDSHDNVLTFGETSPGVYASPTFAGTIGETYKLLVTTGNGREYASQEVVLKNVPEIDSVYAHYTNDFQGLGAGIRIFVDTHDDINKTRFYRWDYSETYEIHQPFPSTFEWLGGTNVVFRDLRVDICWATDTLKNILIKTTQGLSQDQISGFPLRFVPAYDYTMRIKYSILVRQFALSEEGYLFWDNLRVINENQGSLFDVQPGILRGNVLSLTDNSETVLGYFDASVVSEKRVFFVPNDFKDEGYVKPKYLTGCENFIPEEVKADEIGVYMEKNSERMVISEAIGAGNVTFLLRPKYCCDCTNLGTNIKPSFWQ